MGNGRGKKPLFAGLERRPLPIMSSLRAPESWPLTFRSEISQGIARRRVGNLCVDQKEKSARQAGGALPAADCPGGFTSAARLLYRADRGVPLTKRRTGAATLDGRRSHHGRAGG